MIVLIVLIASAIQFSAGEISIDTLISKLDKTLNFMPITYDKNSSYSLALAGVNILLLLKLDEQKWKKWETKIKKINDAIHNVLSDNLYEAEGTPDENYANLFFKPENFLYTFDRNYLYKPGQVRGVASKDSAGKILASPIKIDLECFKKLINNNVVIDDYHNCRMSRNCTIEANSLSEGDDAAMSVEARVLFVNTMAMIQCHEKPLKMYTHITKLCSLLYSQVLKLKQKPIALGTAAIYFNKIAFCGTLGFPEFFADDIVKPIMDLVKKDGSVGSGSDKDIRKVTAQTIAILAGTLRMNIQAIE